MTGQCSHSNHLEERRQQRKLKHGKPLNRDVYLLFSFSQHQHSCLEKKRRRRETGKSIPFKPSCYPDYALKRKGSTLAFLRMMMTDCHVLAQFPSKEVGALTATLSTANRNLCSGWGEIQDNCFCNVWGELARNIHWCAKDNRRRVLVLFCFLITLPTIGRCANTVFVLYLGRESTTAVPMLQGKFAPGSNGSGPVEE